MPRKKKRYRSGSSTSSISPKDYKKVKPASSSFDNLSENSGSSSDSDKMAPVTEETLERLLKKQKEDLVEEFDKKMKETVAGLTKHVDKLESENADLKGQIANLSLKLSVIEQRVEENEKHTREILRRAVNNEQYSRRANLKIYGLDEAENEVCNDLVLEFIRNRLFCSVENEDIDISHRVGKFVKDNPKGPRPIIVKFVRRQKKLEVMKKRSQLKNSRTIMVDDMCRELQAVFNRVKADKRIKDVWTWDSKVFVKAKKDNKVYTVNYGQSLEEIIK